MKIKPKKLCELVLKEIKSMNSSGLKKVSNLWYRQQGSPKTISNIVKESGMDLVYVPTAYLGGIMDYVTHRQKPGYNH